MNNIFTLVACAVLLGGVQSAIAQSAPPPEDSLDEVVVVANRAPEPLSKIGNSVTVLDETTIQSRQEALVSDLLAQTPGVSVARNGGIGQATSVFIRGADSDQTVVLVDGVQLNDPSTTSGGFNFANLLTAGISRIEILRGAQSTLYGSQAIGGVVNIVTADPAAAGAAHVAAEGGSLGTGYVTGDVGGKGDALQWRLSGNWYGTSGIDSFDERYGGVRPNASQIGGGSGQIRYDFTPDLELDLRGYYTEARTDFDGYDTPTGAFGDDHEYGDTSQFVGYAGMTLHSPDRTLTNRLAFQYTSSDSRYYDPAAPANYGSPSTETYYGIGRNEREEYQGTWDATPTLQAVFGAQHERSTIDTDTPAYDVTPSPLRNYAVIDSGYVQVQDEVAPGLTVTGGGRFDEHDVYGGHSTTHAAAAWKLNQGDTVLRASFDQGFKAPSLYQLYSNYGNQALRPEQAHSWDAGVEQHAWDERLKLSATYFERYSRELIEFFDCTTPNGLCATEPYGYYANLARAFANGAELQAAAAITQAFAVSANYTLTRTEDRSPGSTTFGNELPRRPRNAANVIATYRWPAGVTTGVSVRYSGPSFDDAANDIALGGYVLTDARIEYAVADHLDVYARVDNIADKHYETAYLYGNLGRVAYAGMRASF